jgi:phosphoglycerol transferase MdoB-like AlkP superfamily enzyme
MVWLGGALNKTGITIDNFSAQSDLAYTLTDMLGGNPKQFQFGKNIFNTSESQYAHYVFNKGFGTISKNGTFVYDYVSNKPVIQEGNYKPLDSLGRAISQNAYQDFLDK